MGADGEAEAVPSLCLAAYQGSPWYNRKGLISLSGMGRPWMCPIQERRAVWLLWSWWRSYHTMTGSATPAAITILWLWSFYSMCLPHHIEDREPLRKRIYHKLQAEVSSRWKPSEAEGELNRRREGKLKVRELVRTVLWRRGVRWKAAEETGGK